MNQLIRRALIGASAVVIALPMTGCVQNLKLGSDYVATSSAAAPQTEVTSQGTPSPAADGSGQKADSAPASPSSDTSSASDTASGTSAAPASDPAGESVIAETVKFDPSWEYAANSRINTGTATLYHAKPTGAKGIVVCINAGHGTKGGSEVKTLCHPDGTPKVTGGTTEAGASEAQAVSPGTVFQDGTPEAEVTLKAALATRDKLLMAGYDVLMIRETEDVQLDNIARTLMANNCADCHIAIHYDSTGTDKGVFFMSVPSEESYRSMEPVASHYEEHNALGRAVVKALESVGLKLFDGGEMEMDLTQTSYSTVPSIDIEVGDTASDHSEESINVVSDGLVLGVDAYFQNNGAK